MTNIPFFGLAIIIFYFIAFALSNIPFLDTLPFVREVAQLGILFPVGMLIMLIGSPPIAVVAFIFVTAFLFFAGVPLV